MEGNLRKLHKTEVLSFDKCLEMCEAFHADKKRRHQKVPPVITFISGENLVNAVIVQPKVKRQRINLQTRYAFCACIKIN